MAEVFNDFFTSIGNNLQKQDQPTKKTFSDYLKSLRNIISHMTLGKRSDIVKAGRKSICRNSVPMNCNNQS